MRMSRQELLDELKQSDGDPHTKQRLRALRLRARAAADDRRRAEAPPWWSPTRPTVAVALRYVVGETAAPEVLAKGVDTLALKIRKIAAENGIPVIENPPLARALHAACEVGDLIPPAHYQAVAEIISYVLRLGERRDARPSRTEVCRRRDRRAAPEDFVHHAPRILAPMQTPRAGQRRPSMERRTCAGSLRPPVRRCRRHGGRTRPRRLRPPVRHRRVPRRIRIDALPQWRRVLAASRRARRGIMRACARRRRALPEPRHAGLGWLCCAASPARRRARRSRAVNRFVNGWAYRADADNYGRSDYWATPLEFFRRSGDCEDYVIAKYRSLRLLGLRRRPAAHGGGAGRRARPAARRAGGLSRRRGLDPGQSERGGAAAAARRPTTCPTTRSTRLPAGRTRRPTRWSSPARVAGVAAGAALSRRRRRGD